MKKIIALLIILVFCFVCAYADGEDTWPPKGWKQSDYGSFSPDVTKSYDGKYYAIQTLERPEGYNTGFILVTVYESETGVAVDSFLTQRAWDFWGICWEPDNYNIWIQSADVGTYCMCFENGQWSRDMYDGYSVRYRDGERYKEGTYPRSMPDGMIDRFRMRNGSFEYNNAYSTNGLYFAGYGSYRDEPTGAWTSGIEICEMADGRSVFFWPLAEDGYRGVCWEREQNNLWVRLNDNVFCLQYENGTWNRNDNAKRPEYIALAYDWDGTIKD